MKIWRMHETCDGGCFDSGQGETWGAGTWTVWIIRKDTTAADIAGSLFYVGIGLVYMNRIACKLKI